MARFLVVLLAAAVVAVQAGGQLGHAAPATAEVFWRTVLPHSPLPDAILRLLRPAAADTSFVSKAGGRPPFDYQDYKRSSSGDDSSERTGAAAEDRPPFDYQDYKRSSSDDDDSSERTSAAAGAGDFDYDDYKGAEKRHVATAADTPFGYDYRGAEKRRVAAADTPFSYGYKAPTINQAGERPVGAAADTPFGYDYKARSTDQLAEKLAPFGYDYKKPSTATGGGGKAEPRKTTVFFHEEAVRVGERLPFRFPPASPAALGFLPRRVADSVPFTTPALPGVLAAFGVSPSSAKAAGMAATLRACDTPTTIPGESKFCAASLEALVERAMGVLGTRDVRPVTSRLPRAGAPLQTYTVRAVRPVEGGPVFVACHDEPYPYTVYRCHTTGPSRAYMVEMEGARGGGAVSIATVCHTDTSMWNPEHVSFKLLGTKPGGTPVCHLMPYGHIIWAKNVKRSTA